MNNIVSNNNTLPEIPVTDELRQLCRTEDTLRVGDHFFKGSDLIKVSGLNDKDEGSVIVSYDLVEDFENDVVYHHYGSAELSQFIKLVGKSFVPDPGKLYNQAIGFLNGTYSPDLPDEAEGLNDSMQDSTALVSQGSSQSLIELAQQKQLLVRRLSDLQQMAQYHQSVLAQRMRKQIEQLKAVSNRFRTQLTNIQKALSMLQLYMGDENSVCQLASGDNAPADVPFTLHQQLLFMDEECGIISDGGIDVERIEEFDNWLLQDGHLDRLLPDAKGIVALKPRRFRKEYGNPYYNNVMDQWNRHTYFLIRNGQNLYRIDSDHIEISERLFPLRAEMQELYDLATASKHEYQKQDAANRIQSANERYHRIILFIQGLIDHTEVLHPMPSGVNLFKPETYAGWINLVYDDEACLTDGRASYAEWLQSINSTVKRGSRIVFCIPDRHSIGYSNGDLRWYANQHFLRHYDNDFAVPDLPCSGIYTLDTVTCNGIEQLAFKYNPGDSVYSTDYYGIRRNRISFLIKKSDTYINYDRISLDDIDYYLNSRQERKHYLHVLPVLLEVRKSLRAEQKQEDAFRLMLIGQLQQQGVPMNDAKRQIDDAIDWWKYKNIWKRPISNDDAKALRMIRQRVLKRMEKDTVS